MACDPRPMVVRDDRHLVPPQSRLSPGERLASDSQATHSTRLTVLFKGREEWATWTLELLADLRHEKPFDIWWKHSKLEHAPALPTR